MLSNIGGKRPFIECVPIRLGDMARSVPDEAIELLTQAPRIAHLATSHDDRPHVAPLWYNYRDGAIELTTTGRKLENIMHNPYVSISVQQDDDGTPEWAVIVQGTATIVEDEEEAESIFRRVNERYGAGEDAWTDENTAVRVDIGNVQHRTY